MNPTDNINGQTLRKLRRAADLTQTELAERAGLAGGQSQVSKIERYDQCVSAWRIIAKILLVLEAQFENDLSGGKKDP